MLQKDATPPASSEVSKMREIIKKHVDHPVHTWKNMYKKLEQLLDEYEEEGEAID